MSFALVFLVKKSKKAASTTIKRPILSRLHYSVCLYMNLYNHIYIYIYIYYIDIYTVYIQYIYSIFYVFV